MFRFHAFGKGNIVHLLSIFSLLLITNSHTLVSSKPVEHMAKVNPKSLSYTVSKFNTQSPKTIDKSDVNIDKLFKELIILNSSSGYSMVHWFPYELLTSLETDQEYSTYVKKVMSKYTVFFVFTDEDKPKKTDLWIQQNCRLVVNQSDKTAPTPMKYVSPAAREIISEYTIGLLENTGNAGKKMKVVVFQTPTHIDPSHVGTVQLLIKDSSANFSLPVKSLAPKVTCVSCSFVLDSAWQYCPKCSKFIDKKK